MKLKCLCTPNALCSHCQDVIVLQAIAGRLFTAGDQERGNIAVDLAASMAEDLAGSYQERTNEKIRELFERVNKDVGELFG